MSEFAYLDALFAEIEKRRAADPRDSYTAQLLADVPRASRKLGEEAVETVVAALSGSDQELLAEMADLTYHLLALLAARGLTPEQVIAILRAREGVSGLAEKAARQDRA